jgi:hypothetical protein
MALNLSRNTRMWFTTNVNPVTGVLTDAATGYSAFTAANTFELQILDGYTFTQGTNQQTITLNEAGKTPVRGQRSFNTALNPVDFSFSTYIRPVGSTATTITAIEKCLWNALTSAKDLDLTGAAVVTTTTASRATTTSAAVSNVVLTGTGTGLAVGDSINLTGMGDTNWNSVNAGALTITSIVESTNTTIGGTYAKAPGGASLTSVSSGTTKYWKGSWFETAGGTFAKADFMGSNKHQLQKFALIFLVDNAFYAIDNASLNQATIDFGLDAISAVAWSGNGTNLKQLSGITTATQITATAYNSNANYITNKLSTISLVSSIGGATTPTTYVVPITGGSITINNNITYVTPENLGVVNTPIGYFTGTRSITGTLNAYLRTGTNTESGALLNAIRAAGTETKYKMQIEVGGGSNAVRVELDMPGVTVQVPTVDVADVVSTTINFTAQGHDANYANNTYDLTQSNDMTIRYYSA